MFEPKRLIVGNGPKITSDRGKWVMGTPLGPPGLAYRLKIHREAPVLSAGMKLISGRREVSHAYGAPIYD